MIVETPRSRTCTPPPGAPEFVSIIAPAILPCTIFSIVSDGTRSSSAAFTVATAFARLRRDTLVACPVTTISSSASTSTSSRTSTLA